MFSLVIGLSPLLAKTNIDAEALAQLVELQEDAVERVADAPTLSPLETSDREDDMGRWLEDHEVDGAWELAPIFVGAGLTPDWIEQLPSVTGGEDLNGSVRWLAYSVETEMLMTEIEEATRRISTLVHGGEELLAHGPRRPTVGRRPRGSQEHSDDHDAPAARHHGPQGVRPDAAEGPRLPGRAEPGVDQHHRQRRRGHERLRGR